MSTISKNMQYWIEEEGKIYDDLKDNGMDNPADNRKHMILVIMLLTMIMILLRDGIVQA